MVARVALRIKEAEEGEEVKKAQEKTDSPLNLPRECAF